MFMRVSKNELLTILFVKMTLLKSFLKIFWWIDIKNYLCSYINTHKNFYIMRQFELIPSFTQSQKSFYNKAVIREDNNISMLLSYNTPIVAYSHKTDDSLIWQAKPEHISQTTMKHINAFLELFDYDTMSKKEVLKAIG